MKPMRAGCEILETPEALVWDDDPALRARVSFRRHRGFLEAPAKTISSRT